MEWNYIIYILIIFLVAALFLLADGIFRPQSQRLGPVLFRGSPKEKIAALTFDDGPHEAVTSQVLDILKENNVRATFFVVGERARQHPELLQRMIAEGHEIGNHTYSHNLFMSMPYYPAAYYKKEILAVDELMSSLNLPPTLWVRFPVGFKNWTMVKTARRLGKRVAAFSFRAGDSLGGEETLAARVLQKVFPGAVIVLHDGDDKWRNGKNRSVVKALPRLLEGLRERGYRVVTLGELTREDEASKV